MKNKQIPYIDQLLELGKLYKVDEIKLYAKSKKKLTISGKPKKNFVRHFCCLDIYFFFNNYCI